MIGIISDTHENVPVIERVVEQLKALRPELVVHCGDIISPPVLKRFAGLPLRVVFGNNDGESDGLQAVAQELGFGEIGVGKVGVFQVVVLELGAFQVGLGERGLFVELGFLEIGPGQVRALEAGVLKQGALKVGLL